MGGTDAARDGVRMDGRGEGAAVRISLSCVLRC